MSDPYLDCSHCGDQCACRATRDELERYRMVLRDIQGSGDRLLHNEDGGRELEMFLISVMEKVDAALIQPGVGGKASDKVEKSDGDFQPGSPWSSHP